jgi:hypothetical protein
MAAPETLDTLLPDERLALAGALMRKLARHAWSVGLDDLGRLHVVVGDDPFDVPDAQRVTCHLLDQLGEELRFLLLGAETPGPVQ